MHTDKLGFKPHGALRLQHMTHQTKAAMTPRAMVIRQGSVVSFVGKEVPYIAMLTKVLQSCA